MPFPVIPLGVQQASLEALITEFYPSAVGSQVLVHIFKNDVNPDSNASVDYFEEPVVEDGYQPQAITMGSPTFNEQGVFISSSSLIRLAQNAGVPGYLAYGIYITSADGNQLIASQRFSEPQPMGGDWPSAVVGVWRQTYPPSAYGWIDVEN